MVKFVSSLDMGVYRSPEKHEYRNYNERPDGVLIDTVVLHYTVSGYTDAYRVLTAERGVSSHYLVREDGRIDSLVHESLRAWHAGVSYWNQKENVNHNSIGIEVVNSGSGEQGCFATSFETKSSATDCQKKPFPKPQMEAVLKLIQDIIARHEGNIKNDNIIGHGDVAVGRKIDPGVEFDWRFLAENSVGRYFNTSNLENYGDEYCLDMTNDQLKEVQQKLYNFGYKIDVDGSFDEQDANVIRAFKLHYHQQTNLWHCWDNIADHRLEDMMSGQLPLKDYSAHSEL